jgi:GT2 family glycosyltransferase
MDNPLVSVIIINYNTKTLTSACINSVLKYHRFLSFEIIVVDNGSTDGSVEYLYTSFPNIIIISTGKNLGFGSGNNIGVNRSKAKYILLLNSDTIVIKNIITPFIEFYSTHKNLNIGVLGYLLISENSDVLHSFGKFPYLLRSHLKSCVNMKLSYIISNIEKNYFSEVDIISGALMFMERSVFNSFQGFDPNIFLYEEELELQYRMKKDGFVSIIINEKGVIHLEGKSSSGYFKRKCSFLSLCYIMKKHLPYSLYVLFRMKWIIYALIFFKNPRISIKEKLAYLELVLLNKDN